MEKFSISFTLGKAASQHGANVKHNNRKFTAANVDEKRTADNVIFKQQDVRDAYHQLFDRALQEYNLMKFTHLLYYTIDIPIIP